MTRLLCLLKYVLNAPSGQKDRIFVTGLL